MSLFEILKVLMPSLNSVSDRQRILRMLGDHLLE